MTTPSEKSPPLGPGQKTSIRGQEMRLHIIPTENCGGLSVYVQGDLETRREGCIFLTVHDMGSNHDSWVTFSTHESMAEITNRCIFLHVVVPGQETGATDLGPDFTFPSMENLGAELITILDLLRVPQVVGLGCGAGANIITRFGIMHPGRCYGIVAIQPTASAATVMEQLKERIVALKLDSHTHTNDTDSFLVFHKFGHKVEAASDKQTAIKEFKNHVHKDINSRNLKLYVESFMKRTPLLDRIQEKLTCDMLILVGSRSAFVKATEAMYCKANLKTTSIIKLEDVGDVLEEAPERASEAILLFCQGLSLLPMVMGRRSSIIKEEGEEGEGGRRSRRMSMEEADTPNIRRFSLTS